jgi:anti-anti-sigma regulatory factor
MIEPKKKPDPYGVERSAAKPTAQSEPPAAAAQTARFSASVQNGVQIITFEQSSILDAYEIERLGDAIYHHIRPLEAPKVVIDLSHVDHLSNVNKDLHSIFKMTRLDKLARMCDSTEKAVQSLV